MSTCFRHWPLFILFLGLYSCSLIDIIFNGNNGPPPPLPPCPFQEKAIILNFRSDPSLHMYQGRPHTLAICIYQLKDPNAFNQLSEEKEGISKLMDCSNFDPSVGNAKLLIFHPGQDRKETLDRAEGVKLLAIVAGYSTQEKDKAIRRFPIETCDKLTKDFNLGPIGIQDIQAN